MAEAVILTRPQRRMLTNWIMYQTGVSPTFRTDGWRTVLVYAGLSVEIGEVGDPAPLIERGVPAVIFEDLV